VKNSAQFTQTLDAIRIQPQELMVSFDILSLFTNVPIGDSLELLSQHFKNILDISDTFCPLHTSALMGNITNKQTVLPWAHHSHLSLPRAPSN
jgi:hypothetical protein